MSLMIFDTDVITLLQHGEKNVLERVRRSAADTFAVTVLSIEEQLSGWYTELRKAKHPDRLAWAYRKLAANVRFYAGIRIIDFDEPAIQRYLDLSKLKLRIGRTDLQIAASVLEHHASLATLNIRDFKKVPGLRIEDWSK